MFPTWIKICLFRTVTDASNLYKTVQRVTGPIDCRLNP